MAQITVVKCPAPKRMGTFASFSAKRWPSGIDSFPDRIASAMCNSTLNVRGIGGFTGASAPSPPVSLPSALRFL